MIAALWASCFSFFLCSTHEFKSHLARSIRDDDDDCFKVIRHRGIVATSKYHRGACKYVIWFIVEIELDRIRD